MRFPRSIWYRQRIRPSVLCGSILAVNSGAVRRAGVRSVGAHTLRISKLWRLTMNPTKRILLRLMASLLLLSSCALAQTSTTCLQGTVTDQSGSAVTNATGDRVNAETKVQRTAATGSQG